MKPEEIAPVVPPSNTFNRTFDQNPKSAAAAKDEFKDRPKVDKVRQPQLDHIHFNKLEASNTDSQDMAQTIRQVNHSMESIDANLQKMRSSLESIVKIYPPYPPGSSERIEALRQFSAFRKMIDQIAQPGRANGLENILGHPARNPRSGDWTLDFGKRNQKLVIRHQPVHAGIGGLDLPEMHTDSSDAQITAAIEKTSTAIKTLNSRRKAFIADANRAIARIA